MPHVLFPAAGRLRPAYEAVDWAATPLGPVGSWTSTLRNTLDLALNTRFPVTLLWGPEFVLLYNEAYVELIAEKHPRALGARAREIFPEAWDAIGPMMEGVLAGRGATWLEDEALPLHRNGFLEECYFTFSYSPVRNATGAIEGVIDIAAETTTDVIGRRRLQVLTRLYDVLADVDDAGDVRGHALRVLRDAEEDLPAVDLLLGGSVAPDTDPRLARAAPAGPDRRDLVLQETADGRVAWLSLPTRRPGGERPMLAALLSRNLALDAEYLGFLRLIATSLTEALDRVGAREAERGMSEALQRSLLTQPPEVAGIELAASYQPAAQQARIGGDWYDAFVLPDGSLALTIGDVSGHDRHAAAGMAQVRNLLRGVSYTLPPGSPARVLNGLEDAIHGLTVDVFATAIFARVEPGGPDRGGRVLRWCNAGHPPPVLLAPDGGTRLLETAPDLLLGLGATERADHEVVLEPGAAVVLFTDGLVERRGVALPQSLRWLADALRGCQDLTAEQLCEHVMRQIGDRVEDDVALLVVRVEGGSAA